VLNPVKGGVVRRAQVFLGPYRAVADTNGRYRFTSVKPGRYRIYAERPGFWPARQWLTLTDCASVRKIDLTLLASAAIGGHVYDEAGEPLLVNVQLWRETWKHGFRELLEVTRQTTEEGGYRFFGLPAGRYSVSTAQTPVRETRQAYDQTFYPSPLIVDSGSEARDIDFHLRRTPTVTLGLTIEGTFAADQFVSIDLESHDRNTNLHLATNDPKLDIDGLTTGPYKLIATSRYEDQRYYALLNINVGSIDIRGLPVRLLPALDVQAMLRFEGDHAPAALVALSLSPRETAHPEEDGSYKWSDVIPGAYNLSADLPEDFYFKSGRTVEIRLGKQGPFQLVVSAGAARLDGRVQFPDTVDKVRVVLVGTGIEKNALAGSDGAFALTGIAPGQYTLIAIEEDEDQNWRSPETLKALIAKGAQVDLAPGSTVHRDLALTR
jgi:hypothetical protein